MSFEQKSIDDLIRIAHAGGGFRLSASQKSTEDLVRIAHAARSGEATVYFVGLSQRSTDDLISIGHAGKGCVIFEG